jgi:hypothetical protein
MTILTGVEYDGTETQIGNFDQGVVIEGDSIIDCATRERLLVRWANGTWIASVEAKGSATFISKSFTRVHIQ